MQDNSDYIQKYLLGSMSPEEEKEFRIRLKKDDHLYAEYLLETKGKEYIKANAMLEEIENDPDLPRVEAQVEAYFEELEKENPGQEIDEDERKFRKALIAAMAAAAIIGAAFIFRAIITDPGHRIYKNYYEPIAASFQEEVLTRGNNTAQIEQGVHRVNALKS